VGALLALVSSLSWGMGDFLGGRATRLFGALRVLAWSQLASLLLLWIAVGLLVSGGAVEVDWHAVGIAAAGGVAGVTALAMFYSALAIGPMTIVPPIAASGVVLPVTIGLLRGDAPATLAIAGLALGVVGVVLASTSPGAADADGGRGARLAPRTLLLALGAACGFAIIFVALDAASGSSVASAVVATAGVRIGSSLTIALGLFVTRTNPVRGIGARTAAGFVGIGLLDAGANLCFAIATVLGDLEVVSVLASLYPAVTSGLAAVVLRERLGRLQLLGVVLTVLGITAAAT
jgi:drug/metabolite transporter (DMT)-like permease